MPPTYYGYLNPGLSSLPPTPAACVSERARLGNGPRSHRWGPAVVASGNPPQRRQRRRRVNLSLSPGLVAGPVAGGIEGVEGGLGGGDAHGAEEGGVLEQTL
jgi:hypothetical protein